MSRFLVLSQKPILGRTDIPVAVLGGVQQGHGSSVLATGPRQQKLELETVIEAYTYILESHMAPYGANEVELSEV